MVLPPVQLDEDAMALVEEHVLPSVFQDLLVVISHYDSVLLLAEHDAGNAYTSA